MSSPRRVSPRAPRSLSLEQAEPRLLFAADSLTAEETTSPGSAALPLDLLPTSTPQDALANSSITAAADTRGLTGAGQTVVIIDSGIAWDHVAFGGSTSGGIGPGKHIVGGWDFAENDADPYDDGPMGTHGTHVAGILGSLDPRYPGLAPGADIVSLRVFDDQGQGDFPRIEAALRWVHEHRTSFANPITTVNLSLGARWNADGAPEWSIIEDELAILESDGIFISVAAGNSFVKHNQQPGLAYPAASSHVVPVASVDENGALSSFSQRNDRVLAAPGRNVMSAVPDYAGNFNYRADDYLTLSGTSMAAPHVAAASMLVREAFAAAGRAHVTQTDIYAVLRDNADVIYDPITGHSYRVLNLARAIDAVLPDENVSPPAPPPMTTPPTTPPSPTPVPTPAPIQDVVNWGRVDSATFEHHAFTSGAQRQITAANNGLLTIEFTSSATNTGTATLYDADGNYLAAALSTPNGLRLDANVAAGQSYRLHIAGVESAIDVRVTNLVQIDGTAVYVYGTSGNDAYSFAAGDTHEVIANGARYEFASSTTRRMYFLGGDGQDTVSLVGSTSYDAAALRPGKVSLRTTAVLVLARGFETASVDGRTGQDVAYFADSSAHETFTSWGDRAELTGGGSHLHVTGFETVRARSFAGGDAANLHTNSASDSVSRVGPATRLISSTALREVAGFGTVSMFDTALPNTAATYSATSLSVDVSPASMFSPNNQVHDDIYQSIGERSERRPRWAANAPRRLRDFDAVHASIDVGGLAVDRGQSSWSRLVESPTNGNAVLNANVVDAVFFDPG